MPVISRDELRTQLRKRDFAPVYVLFGAENYLRDLAAKTIANMVLDENSLREFNENEFSLNQADNLSYALAAAEQLPMIAARRVVRITEVRVSATGGKDTLKEDFEQLLTAYLSRPSESSVVIFVADELDKRRKMSKVLLEKAAAVEFAKFTDQELVTWARKEIKDSGFDAEEKALHQLVGLVGDNLRKLANEIKKITTAALPDKIVTYELVEALVPNTREISNFDLTDQLFGKDRRKPLQTLKKILDDGAEPLMLLGLIAHNLRRTLMAKELMNQGVERTEVVRVMKLHPKYHEDFLQTARRTDAHKLRRMLERIAATDLAIKTSKGGGGNAGARMQLEMLVCEIVNL
ncbi:MAG TPA: DNA polymerase III subunit delta [Pyrinomonadaceae bacterium]|jgi:DNA polymerase-3 subunit delta